MEILAEGSAILEKWPFLLNALLFVPLILMVLRNKLSTKISLLFLFLFSILQLFLLISAILKQDITLLIVSSLNALLALFVIFLMYQKKDSLPSEEIIKQLPGHIYWKNREGIFLGSNKNNWQDFGLKSLSDYKGKTDYDLFSNKEANKIRLVDQEIILTGQSKIIEEEITNANGNVSLYLSHKVPLFNFQGNIIGLAGVSIDITNARKSDIDRLDFLEKIIAILPGNVYWLNREGIYMGCNDNQAELIGLKSRNEIVGKTNKEIGGFLIAEALDPVNQEVMESGQTKTIEEPAILKDGTKAIFLSNKVPIRNKNNEVIGMVGISIDITDRKKLEEDLRSAKERAELADKLKMDFIHNMEHDIRTPFWGLLGFTKNLEKDERDPERKKLLADCARGAEELFNYCNTMLDFSKSLEGAHPVLAKKFDIRELVNKVIALEMPAAKVKIINLESETKPDIPVILKGDPLRVHCILMNLIGNAIKFTEKGEVKVSILLIKKEDKHVLLQFVVQDTGMGIAPEVQNYIFEKFTRGTPSNQGIYKGLGLGLYLVKKYIEDMQGEIDVKSEIGKGAIFTCTIPFELPLIEEQTASEVPLSVLLVESDPDILEKELRVFQQFDCLVDVAKDGKEALEQFLKKSYDVIFIPVDLSDIPSSELIKAIRQQEDPNVKNIIVALATLQEKDKQSLILESGANEFVVKPIQFTRCNTVFKKYISRYSPKF